MPDAELTTALKQAKSKKMFFALVPKGAEGKLIVAKKKILPKEIAEAKKEIGGGLPKKTGPSPATAITCMLAVAFHPAGERVATVSADGIVRLWETAPGADGSHVFNYRRPRLSTSVAFAPSGRHFAVVLADGTIAIFATPAAVKR
jgi:WD40 repeat protein